MQIVTGLLFIKELPNLINNSIRVCKVIKVSSYRLINRLIWFCIRAEAERYISVSIVGL